MPDSGVFVIGTRGSPLALAQAYETQRRLAEAHGREVEAFPLSIIRTTGDAIQDRPLSEAGGKGLFTKELDQALIDRAIHLAVHSAKDLPTVLPPELTLLGCLPREDARDAFVSRLASRIEDLPEGASFGSASLRRQAQVRRLRPDLVPTLLRGNVGTRLDKVERGEVGATFLAMAGLNRLGLAHRITAPLDLERFLPAVGQGAIAITARAGDGRVAEALAPILDRPTTAALALERAYLAVLDGSCRTPIAGHARPRGGAFAFRGLVLRPDGSEAVEVEAEGAAADAAALGDDAGRRLKARLPAGFLQA